LVCPACGAELSFDSRKVPSGGKGKPVCPYDGFAYAVLRAGHDKIYFGRWRKIDSSSGDVLRAYHQLGRHLAAIGKVLGDKDLPAARRDLAKAQEAHLSVDPREDTVHALRLLDHALSYAHRVIDDLLHEDGLPPHYPMDFAAWYDTVEVPFREEW
jgi:hypothetical protein